MIAFAAGAVIVFAFLLVRRRQLQSKYALLWLSAAVPLGILATFPGLLDWLARIVGVQYPPALFLFLAVVFLFFIVMQYSLDLSRLYEQSRILAEELALLVQMVDSDEEDGDNGRAPADD